MNNKELQEIGYKEIKFPNGSTLIRSDEGVWGERWDSVTITTSAEEAADELVLLVEAQAKELERLKFERDNALSLRNVAVKHHEQLRNQLQTAVEALEYYTTHPVAGLQARKALSHIQRKEHTE